MFAFSHTYSDTDRLLARRPPVIRVGRPSKRPPCGGPSHIPNKSNASILGERGSYV